MIREIIFIFLTLGASVQAAPNGSRIVGGTAVDISQRNFQLALVITYPDDEKLCGGSIIAPNKVLTAAHCVDGDVQASWIAVRAGSNYYDQGGVVLSVDVISVHPSFNPDTLDKDVAVLTTSTNFEYSSTVGPITLATNRPFILSQAVVSGYGATSSGGDVAPSLMEVTVPIISNIMCMIEYVGIASITSNMICAGSPGKDSCQGDSGGPLTVGSNLVGVVSFGYGCATYGYPGVYSSVANLNSWITSQ